MLSGRWMSVSERAHYDRATWKRKRHPAKGEQITAPPSSSAPATPAPRGQGRRIEAIDGGWRLLNHAKYRELRDEEAIKESKRRYINAKRTQEREAKRLGVILVGGSVEKVERENDEALLHYVLW
jgi:hypothetical protein